jgi:hypothetical protein
VPSTSARQSQYSWSRSAAYVLCSNEPDMVAWTSEQMPLVGAGSARQINRVSCKVEKGNAKEGRWDRRLSQDQKALD